MEQEKERIEKRSNKKQQWHNITTFWKALVDQPESF
jgi:hypothetical protein